MRSLSAGALGVGAVETIAVVLIVLAFPQISLLIFFYVVKFLTHTRVPEAMKDVSQPVIQLLS